MATVDATDQKFAVWATPQSERFSMTDDWSEGAATYKMNQDGPYYYSYKWSIMEL